MTRQPHACERGFTLIELMVSVVIGLVLTLAVTTVVMRSEGSRRTLTALNDSNQAGAYAAYVLDRTLRSAASGYAQQTGAYGCRLNAARGGAVRLPLASGGTLPAPFAGLATQAIRLAPVLISKGASATGSDVLTVMTGAAGRGETAYRVLSNESAALLLPTTLGVRANDLVLLTQGSGECMVQQVSSTFSNASTMDVQVGLAGTFTLTTMGTVQLSDFGSGSAVMQTLGNSAVNQPMFQMIGVGANATLMSYDLLNLDGNNTVLPIADGIVAMYARYGVDNGTDNVLDAWVDPSGDYDAATLMDGSTASQARLQRIVAVRVGLVLRSAVKERSSDGMVAPESLLLFESLGTSLRQTHTIATADRQFRHRTVEVTVPLSNVILGRAP